MSATETVLMPDLKARHEGVVHLTVRRGKPAYCGSPLSHPHYFPYRGQTKCPICNVPVCPTCRSMADAYHNSGIIP